jgi:hypothetical protein
MSEKLLHGPYMYKPSADANKEAGKMTTDLKNASRIFPVAVPVLSTWKKKSF